MTDTFSVQQTVIGELKALLVTGNDYQAVIALQGSQLLYFSDNQTATLEQWADNPLALLTSPDNWLWVSRHARFEQGLSVRGGVPICWPLFGVFERNPTAVQNSFANCPFDVSKHGLARTQPFEVTHQRQTERGDELTLTLSDTLSDLSLSVTLRFNADGIGSGFGIETLTENKGERIINFSQALHTYLPTSEITQTRILGFNGSTYADATTSDWLVKTQTGDIEFVKETDRIYLADKPAPVAQLVTPDCRYRLTSTGSKSTVIWNPWAKLAKQLADSNSQFGADEYQKMLCIETANAHDDYVALSAGASHRLGVWVERRSI